VTKEGVKAALNFGEKLPTFDCLEDAESALYSHRNECLVSLTNSAQVEKIFEMDFTPESLKKLESWYFRLHHEKYFEKSELERFRFLECMAIYLGAVAVKHNPDVEWRVYKYRFSPKKYAIGVQKGTMTLCLSCGFENLHNYRPNKNKDYLFREYQRWFGQEPQSG
jgi:hypothetical protein